MQGWIKLHRNIMESSTFKTLTSTQKLIAIYLILNANHEDGLWFDQHQGIQVPVRRGQLITSRNKIANEWFQNDKEITEQKVRTTLVKLEKLGFLTIESTNRYTFINIVNYSVYQASDKEGNQHFNQGLTSDQPGLNQGLTTNKNEKNVKNDKEDINTLCHKFETCDLETAELLYHLILQNNPEAKKPNLEKWAKDIRLMRERDKRTIEQIKYLIEWTQKDSFWMTNILSPDKLRKKFDMLVVRVKQERKGKPKVIPSTNPYASDDEFFNLIGGD